MHGRTSIAIGDFLYKHLFPVYNVIYPLFKKWQDASEIRMLHKMVRQADTILDIGGNIGFYTKILSKLTGTKGKVFTFEPEPQNLTHLRKAVGSLTNVTIIPKAVSDTTGVIKLYTSSRLNVDHRTYASEYAGEVIEIESVALDDLFAPGTRIDIVKMDIQGSELLALKGMERVLADNPHIRLLMEFWPHGLKGCSTSVYQLADFLQSKGFRIYVILKDTPTPLTKSFMDKYADAPDEIYFNIVVQRQELTL